MFLTAEPQPCNYASLITHYLSNSTDKLNTGCNLMKDQSKTKQVLIHELVSLRHRISELERSESELKREKEVLKDSESKYQFLAENMSDVIFTVDLNLMTTYISPSIERLLGYTPQERMTQKADQQLTLKSQKLIFETLSVELGREKEKGSDPDRSKTLELEYYHKDGSIKHLLTYVRGIRDSKGNLTGFYGSSHDITERKRAEEELRQAYSFRNAIIDNVAEGLCVCHETKEYPFVKFTIWNDRMTDITGYTVEEINLLGWYQTVYPDPELQAKAIERMKRMRQSNDLRNEEWEIIRADGNQCVLNISTSVVESDDGVVHVLAIMQDITDRKRMEEEIFTLSITDQLTGLYNRRGFLSLAGQQLKLSERNKSGLLLFFADLDLLKLINDLLGHKEGDKALIESANIFKETFRASDIIARLGGDEFAVLAIDIKGTNPEVFTTRLQQLIDIWNNRENRKYKLSISMGFAYYDPENPRSIDNLIARADKLMYEQKQNKQIFVTQMTSVSTSNP